MKRTIAEAITSTKVNVAMPGTLVEFEPGNCTRYNVFFQPVSEDVSGCEGGATLVLLGFGASRRPSILIPKTCGYLSLDYFSEKTAIDGADAEALVKLIGHQLGITTHS